MIRIPGGSFRVLEGSFRVLGVPYRALGLLKVLGVPLGFWGSFRALGFSICAVRRVPQVSALRVASGFCCTLRLDVAAQP